MVGGGDAAEGGAGDDDLATLIDAERESIRAGMREDGIGAASVCLVDGARTAWMEGFGRTSAGDGEPVAADTIFSIQSTSKNFTAVAVLLAVQEGLLDLDTPIPRYLPGFTVRSRFEQAPQDRITLRLLLANRAGFTHEAPVGNNYEPESPGFEAHVDSISRTWLRFPVGQRYRYSNLGYDLAGWILQQATGMPYAQWLQRKLFRPLGMRDSTADADVYTSVANRAIGSQKGHERVPPVTPHVASGGVYASARDMARYAAFHLAGGASDGKRILAPELWHEMHGFGLGGDYGLGVIRQERLYGTTPLRMLSHRGGGFGFGCEFLYCPDAGLAWVAMFNRAASAGYRFAATLFETLLTRRFGARAPRCPASALASITPTDRQMRALAGRYIGRNVRADIVESDRQLHLRDESGTDRRLHMTAPDELFTVDAKGDTVAYRYHAATDMQPAHLECAIGEASLDHDGSPDDTRGPDEPEWDRYVGQYRIDQWGRPALDIAIERRHGYLALDGIRLIVEHEPGLFFTSDGEAVDFRTSPPTWRNLRLRRV